MILRLKIEFLRLSPGRHHWILSRRTSFGTTLPRKIRDGKQQTLLLRLHLRRQLIQIRNLVRLLLHPSKQIVRRLLFRLPHPHLLTNRIPFRLQLFHLPQQPPSLLIHLQNLVQTIRRTLPTRQ